MYANGNSIVWVKMDDPGDFHMGAAATRTSNKNATIELVSTEDVKYYYQVSEDTLNEADLIVDGEQGTMTAWTSEKITLTDLEAGEQTLYILGKNDDNSRFFELTIPAYVAPPPQGQPQPDPAPMPPMTGPTHTTTYNYEGASSASGETTSEQQRATISFGGAAGSRGVNFNPSRPRDITVTLNAGASTLKGLRLNGKTLEVGVDYTISGDKVTLTADFLSTLPRGRTVITFIMNGGNNPTLTINIRGSAVPAAPAVPAS
jgi:hypothetical protein